MILMFLGDFCHNEILEIYEMDFAKEITLLMTRKK